MTPTTSTTALTIRGLRTPADYEAMASILEASRAVDGYDTVRSAGQLRAALESFTGFVPSEDLRLAEIEGQVVGFAYAMIDGDNPELGRIFFHAGSVEPQWRGIGVGRELLSEVHTAALRSSARRPGPAPDRRVFRSFAAETDTAARRLLEHAGYGIARYAFSMVRPTLDEPPPVALPDGVELRAATKADLPAIGRAWTEAFADDWGMGAWTEEEILGFFGHPLYGQLDVWQVAWAGGQPIGGVLGFINEDENTRLGRRRGYTENIWTLRPWRGRGIATALIGANLRLLAQRGMTEAALSVDTENPTGALALYQKVGFVRTRTDLVYQQQG
jgi:mycothiol synthase